MTLALRDIRIRDPFILNTGAGYVLFGTTDANLWGGPGTGFDCYTSDDLEQWNGPIPAFRPPTGFWGTTQFWAPEVHAYQGRFFMFATFAGVVDGAMLRGTTVLVADEPTGPFAPWSDGPVTPLEVPCLDGTLHIDDDGNPWIVYSRGAEGNGVAPALADGEMYARPLTADLRAPTGDPVLLFHSTSAAWSRPMRLPNGAEPPPELGLAKDPYFTDGAFLVRADSGELFMLWSAFGERGYAMGVAQSESGHVLGPWRQFETPVWPHDGGHGMVFRTRDDAQWLVFHEPNDSPHERPRLVPVVVSSTGISLA